MSRRQISNRARKFARAIELETLEVRQLLSSAVLPDFTVIASSLTATTVNADDNDHIDFTVQNVGTADAQQPNAGSWYDAVIATTDTTFNPNSPNDRVISFPGNPSGLDIGASYNQGVDFGTGGWAPGTYNIFVIADYGGWVAESDETNNVSTPVTLTVNAADLTSNVNSVVPTTAPSAGLGEQLTVNWTVTNNATAAGSTSGNTWYDIVWISPDSALDTSDPASIAIGYFNNANTSPLQPGDSYTNVQQVNVPTNIAPGSYNIFVQTNQFSFQIDANPGNDISPAFPIQVTAADLVVSSAQADSGTHNVGDSIPISWTVTNQGNAAADGAYGGTDWHDAVYWSYSPTFDNNAHLISDVDYSNTLAAGASYATPQQYNVDTTNWDGGQYYFFVKTDWYGWQEPESNENNNISAAIPVTINATDKPDLTVILNSASAGAAQIGSTVDVNFTVQNSAAAAASTGAGNTWWEAVWLSKTPNLVQGDATVINYWWNGYPSSGSLPLDPGATYTEDGNVTIPSNIGTGQYYLIVTTDQFNNIPETDGGNNVSNSIPIEIDGSDLQLDDFQVNGADANIGYTPDLGEIPLNTPFTVQWNVSNQGNLSTQNTYSDAIYISTSQTFDPATAQLLYYSTDPEGGPANVGDSYQGTATLSLSELPAGAGTYYLFAVTDALGDEPEGNENNNVSNPIQFEVPGPDLALNNSVVNNYGISPDPNTIILDQDFNVSWEVDNNTDVSINNGWYDSVYISTSSTFDPSTATQLLTFQPEPGGFGGYSSYTTGQDFTLSSYDYAPGQYYIFVVTDDGNQVAESNENNNIQTLPVTIKGSDLVVTDASVTPTEANVGDTVKLDWTVQNQGESAAGNGWYDEYFISTSPDFNINQAYDLGGNYEGSYLNPGDAYSDSANIDLSNYSIDGGPYYLFVVTDIYNYQGEDNEDNNVSAPILLNLDSTNQVDLTPVIDTSNTDSSVNVGSYLSAQWSDNNIGSAATNGSSWNDQVWLSPTPTFDPGTAISLGSVNVGGGGAAGVISPTGMNPINADPIIVGGPAANSSNPSTQAGGSTLVSGYFFVPENIGDGTFYLFVQTDITDNQAESTNTNNLSSGVPITVLGSDLTVTASLPNTSATDIAPDGSTAYAGGLIATYYATGSINTSTVANAQAYISANAPSGQFLASQVAYPANQGLGGSDGSNDTLANYLGTDSNSLSNFSLKSNQLTGQIIEFDGFISLPAGTTTLWLGSDDGAQLFLNGDTTNPLIDNDGDHGFTWASNTFDAPSAGLYAVKIVYFDDGGSTGIALGWNDSNGDRVVIPSSDLYSAAPAVIAGQPVSVNWTVTNQGNNQTQNGWYDSIYISNSPVFDSSAVFVGNQYNGNILNAGDSYDTELDISIPGYAGTGTKYLFVVTDDNDYEPEGNENNNVSSPIQIVIVSSNADLEPTTFIAPYSATLGEVMPGQLSWSVSNNGSDDASGDWNDEIYLSQNPWIDSSSVLLNQYDALNNGWPVVGYYGGSYSTDQSGSITIPANVAPGSYYIILAVDGDSGQTESNYANNDLVRPIQIVPPNDDLQVTDATANGADLLNPVSTPLFTLGEEADLSMTVVNTGTADATNTWTDAVYLSNDNQFDGSDILLGFTSNGDLPAGDSYVTTLYSDGYGTIYIPSNTAPGSYYLLFVTDTNNEQPETDETNNVFAAPVTIAGPDLTVTAVSTQPAAGNFGDQFTATWTVQNQGVGPADSSGWYDAVYVSNSSTFSYSTAIYVGEQYRNLALNSNDSYDQSLVFTMPGGLSTGNAYVYVIADSANYLPETNEANNVSSAFPVNITGGPDLQVQNVTINSIIPTPTVVNSVVNISWDDVNTGTSPANASYWYDTVYVSNSSTFNLSQATSIGTFTIYSNSLAVGSSIHNTNTAAIPSNLVAGNYWIYVYADIPYYYNSVYGNQAEINENNNVSSGIEITVNRADLTVTTANVDTTTLAEGQSTGVEWTISNPDPTYSDAGAWNDVIYLSTTPDLSGSRTLLVSNGSGTNSPLAPGGSYSYDQNVTIPTNTAAGNYYLLFITDNYNYVGESNENNNFFAVPVTVTNPDLTITGVSIAPNPVSVSDNLSVTWTVRNLGSTPAYGAWYDAVWLSQNGVIDSNSIALGYVYENGNGNPVLQPYDSSGSGSDSYAITQDFTVPSWVAEGNYTVIVKTDGGYGYNYYNYSSNSYSNINYDDNQVAETNESNNIVTTTVSVGQPDLTVTNAVAPATANSGDTIPVSFTVSNLDTVAPAVAGWYDGVYLSSTPTLTGGATLLKSWYHDGTIALEPEGSYNISDSIVIPENAGAGAEYLIFVSDIHNYQTESNENNNAQAQAITINSPDLTVVNPSGPAEGIVGTNVAISWTTQNIGATPADGPWWDNVYLSSNGALDGNSTYLGQVYAPNQSALPLAAGASYDSMINGLIPAGYTNGIATIFIVVDYYNSQAETNENNNIASFPIDIESPDLTVSSASADTQAVPGGALNVSWTVTNSGTSIAPNAWYDRISISPDTNPADAVYTVDIHNAGALAAGDSYSVNGYALSLPASLATGTYHVLITTDYYNNQAETSESNNTSDAGTVSVIADDLAITGSVAGETTGGSAGGLTAYYYGAVSGGAGSVANAQAYIASHSPLAQFVATQVQYPAGNGIGASDSDGDTLANFLGADANSLDNPAVKSNTLSGQIIEFDGFISLPAGNTTLWLGSDDGSELFLNGSTTPLINDDGSHGFAWTSGAYDAPAAGLYAVKIIYFEGGGSTGVGLAWNDSQGDRVTIPEGDLFSAVSTVVVGNSVDLSWTVTNTGTTTALNSWTDRISISPDNNPANAIYSYDVANSGDLAAGSSYSMDDFLLNLPNTLAQGTYHVLVSTDADNNQVETNENNNTVDAGLISIDATDLTVSNPSGPALAIIGSPAAISWTTQNIGNYPAQGPWVDNVYISADGQFSDATVLGQIFSTDLPAGTLPLAAGGQYTITGNFTIPSNTPTGSYTVFVVTDAYNQIPETDENNNVASFTMDIGAPDLVVSSASADATANIGTNMNVAWTVSNNGSSAAPDNWKDTVYLTPDGNIADAVYHADFNHTGGLSASNSYSNSQVLSIPLSLATGTYSVVIVTDSANAQPETNETNNSYTVGVVNVVAPDLTITTASAPSTVTPGGTAAISWTVENAGGGATISNWYDQVYISSDSTFDANAVYLGSFNAPTLGAGASYTQSKDLTIPAGTASGNQYIIIVTDYGNQVVETSESNNTYSVPLTVAPVNVSIGDTSITEGDSGTTNMTFTVTLSAATGSTTSVSYSTSNGTASAGSDYQGVSGQLVFAPGITTQQITVPVYGDYNVEDDETVEMELSNPIGLSLGNSTATGTIFNDDFGGSIQFDSATYSTPEGNSASHNVSITVDRTGGGAAGISIPYTVTAGTATDGVDFAVSTGMLTFGANQNSATFNVLVYGDTVYEPDETINLSLGTPTTAVAPADSTAVATLGSPSTSVLTILNDDAEPAISISNVSANEGNSGLTPFTFTVTLSNSSQSPITVNYATADDSATLADNDYQPTSGMLTFAPGTTTSQTITVNVVGDTAQESDETFFVNLTSPSGATLSNTQGTGTIVNDDTDVPPTIVSLQNISGLRKNGTIASADFNLSKPGTITDPSTWASNFITLTLNGASVDTSSLTIVSDDSNGDYTINGLGALTSTPGLYVLTLNASAVTDNQGVHGVGTASDTFTIDTAPSVSINNPSQSGGVGIYTDTGSFTDPDGSVGDSWTATVDYGDGTGPQALTLSGMNFSLSHDYSGAGNYTATVVVTDSVGETGSNIEQFNIVNAPTITLLSSIAAVVTGGVSSVNVTFSQPINVSTLKSAVTLRRGGISIDDSSITIADDGANTYTINGLAPLTSAFGAYVLSIDATHVQNTVGVSGTGSASDSWQEDTAPAVTSAAFDDAAIPTNTISSGAVQFSDPDPSPDSWTGTISFGDGTPTTALTPGSGQTFIFSHAYATSGGYTATVIVTDQYGLSDTEQFNVNVQDRTTITSLQSISGLQASAISSVNFSLSKPGSISDPSTWAANFISLRRGGASVSTSSLSIVSDDSNGDYTINGLGALTDVPGQYVLTLDATAVTDIYGIQGTGTASDTWTRDTAPSASVTNSTVTGGVGITLSDTGSFTDPDGAAGDSWTATVDYGDGTGPQALTLSGNDFTLSHSFASTGDYTATVVVTDSVGETGTAQAAFDVVNGPTIVSLQSISGVLTAGVSSVDVTFSQPIDISTLNSSDITLRRNGASVSGLSVTVKSDGGNTYTISGLSALTSAFGAYQLTINAAGVQNLDGVAGSGSASDQWQEDTVPSITNVSVNSNYIAVGSSLTGTLTFTDPDPTSADSWTATINDGEGNPDRPLIINADQSFDFSHVYNTPGVYAVTLTVTDAFGESAVASFDVHVEEQPTITNLESISSPQTGGVQSVNVTFSEPINIDTLNSSDIILRRGGISIDASSLSVTAAGGNTYTIGNLGSLTGAFGFYTLTIDAASVQNLDGIAGTGSASDSWQEDTAPVASTTHNTASVVEGSVFSDTGSFVDPDPSPDAWTATVNYGDGVVEPLTLSGKNFDLSHTFSSYGLYDVEVNVTDAYGLSNTIIEQVTVTQTPATITLPADAKVNINTPLSFNGTAIDSNAGDPPFTLSVDYGDGTGSHALAVTGGNFTFTPDYSQAGRYTVTVTATDQDGTTSSDSMEITAVPNVRPIIVNDGLVERSKVGSVTVSFDDNVNVSASSFTVLNTKTNATVPYTIQQIDGKTYKLVFTTLDAGGSIADGHYSVTVNSANVTDSAGDTLISDVTQTFWRRFGDFYGNGYVTLASLNLMKSLVGKTSANDANWTADSAFDYNGDGALTNTDLSAMLSRYGAKIY